MKTLYTAEIEGHPETRCECSYNVAGGDHSTHRDLAERTAISAAMTLAEPGADGWEPGAGRDEWHALLDDETKSHTIRVDLKGKAWGEDWTGTVTVDGKRYPVTVR